MKLRIIDRKFRQNKLHYLFQCGLAGLAMLAVLLFLNVLEHTAILASLGSTAFVIFTVPRSYLSRPRPVIGGYLVAIATGWPCHELQAWQAVGGLAGPETSLIIFGALAVAAAILAMALTNTEHAPAAGVALGLVLNPWDYVTLTFIFGAALFFSLMRWLLKDRLMDLIRHD